MHVQRLPWIVVAFLVLMGFTPEARAGGSAETTLIVVNEDSPLSVEVARRYAALRRIPANHICGVRDIPSLETITIEQFRERILGPVLAFIRENELTEEIDLIAYSVDFPFGVDFKKETEGKTYSQAFQKFRVASINGLTCLYAAVEEKSDRYLTTHSNGYVRSRDPFSLGRPQAFRHGLHYTPGQPAEKAEEDDERYYLSMVLGHTGFQGNTQAEIMDYLARAARSDGKSPDGVVYLMENTNVRATTRMPYFRQTIDGLKALEREAAILKAGEGGENGKTPQKKNDVLGLVAGTAGFNWAKSSSTFVDGAIAEHLTSFGGKLDGSGQTKITEYLRFGACGSSGTVAEPYALWFKFPLPYMHVYYASGCSMAESFYSAVASPYQLLMLGDPLARPFARFAQVELKTPTDTAWKGEVQVAAQVTPARNAGGFEIGVGHVELWLGGQYLGQAAPGEAITLDTTAHADGQHELRLVAVEDTPVATRSSRTLAIQIDNHGHNVTIRKPRKTPVPGTPWDLLGKHSGAKEVILFAGHRRVGEAQVRRTTWKMKFDPALIGPGPVALQAVATYADGRQARSAPFAVELPEPPTPGQTKKKRTSRRKKKDDAPKAGGKTRDGLQAIAKMKKGEDKRFVLPSIGGLRKTKSAAKWIGERAQGAVEQLTLTGEILIPAGRHGASTSKEPAVYRLAIRARGRVKIVLREDTIAEFEACTPDALRFAAVKLAPGWHPVEIELTPEGSPLLDITIGGPCVHQGFGAKQLRHAN